jgi:aldehyde:ferredoxin oxidoreductase
MDGTLDVRPTGILEMINAATGANYTLEELEQAGERIFNAERLFLMRVGFDRSHDTLPPRIVSEPMPDGPARGMVCHLSEMLDAYYPLRGWSQDGKPTEEKLRQLGL